MPTGERVDPVVLRRMTEGLAHRGPDDRDTFVEGRVGLGHTRLAVLDLSPRSRQPMRSSCGRYVLTYNGEVYNFRTLAGELKREGVQLRTTSDTEVVLEALARWGVEALARFEGMFALALWDILEERLLLARDRFGIKPLFLGRHDGRTLFASEISPICSAGCSCGEMDPQSLAEFLWFGVVHGEQTFYRGVRRVPAGTWLWIDANDEVEQGRYFALEDLPVRSVPWDDAVVATRNRLQTAVRSHLISDVPVGVFLSGGLDSSAIVAFASRDVGDLETYTVSFSATGSVDETAVARSVARTFGTRHRELEVGTEDLPDVLQRLIEVHGQPFGDAADIPLFLLSRELRGGCKVVLQGDGGDEVFAGYRRYPLLRRVGFWAQLAKLPVPRGALLRRGWSGRRVLRWWDIFREADDASRMARLRTPETEELSPISVLDASWRRRLAAQDPFRAFRELSRRLGCFEPAERMLRADLALLLPDQFLEKVDRATMAHGIEARVPFLDVRLTEHAMGLPLDIKMRGGTTKAVLRAALRGVVPDHVIDRRKQGFGVPFRGWLGGSMNAFSREVFTDPAVRRAGLFDERAVLKRLDHLAEGEMEWGFVAWKALQLALWATTPVGQKALGSVR